MQKCRLKVPRVGNVGGMKVTADCGAAKSLRALGDLSSPILSLWESSA